MADLVWEKGYQFFDDSGDPLNAGTINIYDAGTESSRTVYQDDGAATPWTQPITLNSAGRLTASVYVPSGDWKFVLADSGGTTIATEDNIPGAVTIPSAAYAAPRTPIITKATDYTIVVGDLGSKVEVDASGGDRTISLLAAASTSNGDWIIIQNTGASGAVIIDANGSDTINGALTVTLTFQYNWAVLVSTGAAWTGFIFPEELSAVGQASVDVASSTTTSIGDVDSTTVRITGAVTITGFGTVKAGVERWVRFAGAPTLTHNATSLILPGAANITAAAGDVGHFKSEGSGNWRCHTYVRASAAPLSLNQQFTTIELGHASDTTLSRASAGRMAVEGDNVLMATADIASQANQETGTATDKLVTSGRQHYHPGHNKFWAYVTVSGGTPTLAASENVSGIVDDAAGRLTVTIDTNFSSTAWAGQVSTRTAGGDHIAQIRNAVAQSAAVMNVDNFDVGVSTFVDPESWNVEGVGDQ